MPERSRSVLVAVASMGIGAAFLAVMTRRTADGVWTPFAWLDLAVVHLAAAWLAARCVPFRELGRASAWVVILLGAVLAMLLARHSCATFAERAIQRGLLSLGLMIVGCGVADRLAMLVAFKSVAFPRSDAPWTMGEALWIRGLVGTLALATCFALPAIFAVRRVESGLAVVESMTALDRPATAAVMAAKILVVDPRASWQGRPLTESAAALASQARAYRKRLDASDPASTGAAGLERCRLLAAVGEWDAAVRAATAIADDPAPALEASLLLGLLCEERQQWRSSRDWYAAACRRIDAAPGRGRARRVEALNGVGFAERNLGNLVAAEAAYRESLEVQPLATTHAQLAGVYEDAKNFPAALAHARAAAELEPFRVGTVSSLEESARRHRFCQPQRQQSTIEATARNAAR